MFRYANILSALQKAEGFKDKPYICPKGAKTIGWGFNITSNGYPSWLQGRNFNTRPLSEQEGLILLKSGVEEAEKQVRNLLTSPVYDALSLPRQDAVIEMCFNVGVGSMSGFVNTIKALSDKDYTLAATEMLDSQWATSELRGLVERAKRLSKQIRTGLIQRV